MISSTEALEAPIGRNSLSYKTVPTDQDQIAGDVKDYIETWLLKVDRLRTLPEYLKKEVKTKLEYHADGV